MKNTAIPKIAFLQRLLPLYRLGFYKALAGLDFPYHLTIFCPKGEDTATHIKTISPETLNSVASNRFDWVDTRITFYNTENILWQRGILMPLVRKEFDILMISNKMSHIFWWLLILVCKIRGIKIIFWSHGLQGNETGFKLWLKNRYLGLADVNLVYANYSKDLLIKSGFNPDKIQVVYNSLDFHDQDLYYSKVLNEDRIALKRKLIGNDYPVVIFLGRLEKTKKIEMLLHAGAILKNRGVYINILIAGKGPELAMLKALSSNVSLDDRVHFLGRLEEPELVQYFYFSDISVSPGNVGLNCIHSLNYGVPVITHNELIHQYPEVEALTENETGVFFNYGDVEDLANKIAHWLKDHPENTIAEKLRRMVKSRYSPQVQAQCVIDGISLLYK